MSLEATCDSEALEAIRDVRTDSNELRYVICGHLDGQPNQIGLVASGTDTGELVNKFDSGEFLYCLARYETEFDMSSTVKFVYIRWTGDKVPFSKRGRFGVVQGSISQYFEPRNITIDTNTTDDLTDEHIKQELNENSGTKSKVLEDSVDSSGKKFQMRGFTQTQLPQRESKKSFGVSAVAAKGADVIMSEEVYEAVNKVRADDQEETWMVAGYQDGKSAGPVVSMGSGSGDIEELKQCLDPSIPSYALYKVTHEDSDEIKSSKFIFITWVGPKVKPMVKAKISTHKGTISDLFTPAHTTVFATELSEINERDIMCKIVKLSGR